MSEIEEKQKVEILFWRDSKDESPEADSLNNIVNKISEAEIVLDCFKRHQEKLSSHGKVLELGGGQGWASCLYKRLYPSAHVTTTDISKYAVMSLPKWERLYNVKIDHAYACKSYETNESDASVDFLFCFAAAHHVLAHKRTLQELSRVLKPGAKAIFFYEPATPIYLRALAQRRVNRKRPEVPEDLLVTSELRTLARKSGLDIYVDFYPCLIRRGPFETIYYFVLARIPFLQKILPCTANFIFTKNT